jgi:hypothetical protein
MSNANPTARFCELASVHSDCSSARDKGSLGVFGRGQMQKVRGSVACARVRVVHLFFALS